MNNKVITSIQYQLTNNWLVNEVYYNWDTFYGYLKSGPEEMKKYLFEKWNEVKNKLKTNDNLIIKDLNREVSASDFDVTFNKTNNGILIFFISFPDYNGTDGASKYVAIAFTSEKMRYFTLEYSGHSLSKDLCWVIGEFEDDRHYNYGTSDNMRLSWFVGFIMGLLENNN